MNRDLRTRLLVALAALLLLALPAATKVLAGQSADWPMYAHDAQHSGYNPAEKAIGAANVDQLTLRWHAFMGPGGAMATSSAPIVAGDTVYAGSSSSHGDNYYAFDAASGAKKWSTNLHFRGGCLPVGIGATAAVSGTLLVVGGGDGSYYGLSSGDGSIRWRSPLDEGPSAFAWASPLLALGRAYVGAAAQCDNPSVRGVVRALDPANGASLADTYFVPAGQRGAGVWNSAALSLDGTRLIVTTGEDFDGYDGPYNRAIVALDPLTLAILDAHKAGVPNADQDWATSPLIFHDAKGRQLVAAIHKDGTLYAYRLDNLAAGPIWQRSVGVAVGMMPAYDPTFGAGGTLFAGNDSGTLYAFDAATGQDRWAPVSGYGMSGPLTVADGLLFLNGIGALRIVDERDGSTLRLISPPDSGCTNSGPIVANGFVYWLSGLYLNAAALPDSGPTATPTPSPTPTPRPPTTTPNPSSTPCAASFSDVHHADFFYNAVRELTCAGIISGYADGTFRPYNGTTRGQLVKLVVLAEGFAPDLPEQPTFSDVDANNAFYSYIETAVAHGIISGYCDGTFQWGANVTRGQVAKIIVVARGWPRATKGGPHFSDVTASSPFYSHIETAYAHDIISGYADHTFRPYNNSTRGQIAKIEQLAR